MAHAAPVPGGRSGPATTTTGRAATVGTGRPPDVFSARTHRVANVVVAIVLGLVYGYWCAANRRFGGEITGWNLLFGFVTAFVFAALYLVVHSLAPHMRRELHALMWAAFAGSAAGFLYSQSTESVLGPVFLGILIAAAGFAVLFYRYYTHEDAQGRRIG
ncbi:hypothetical protein ACFYNL_17640 [Streptomyces sp. NPDC007808]|uniref:hypothetical protein n=1 Tax=Streptomyces sp. NPDC007808 TaxID=3364779 RepID=UPI0036AC0688